MQVYPSCGERHPDRAVLHDVRDAVHDRGRACGSAGTFERMALIGQATAGVYGSAAVQKIISDTDELERQAESFPSLRGLVLDMRSEVSAFPWRRRRGAASPGLGPRGAWGVPGP